MVRPDKHPHINGKNANRKCAFIEMLGPTKKNAHLIISHKKNE